MRVLRLAARPETGRNTPNFIRPPRECLLTLYTAKATFRLDIKSLRSNNIKDLNGHWLRIITCALILTGSQTARRSFSSTGTIPSILQRDRVCCRPRARYYRQEGLDVQLSSCPRPSDASAARRKCKISTAGGAGLLRFFAAHRCDSCLRRSVARCFGFTRDRTFDPWKV